MCTLPDTNPLPTIVIIHDAWHTPTHYSKLVDLLTAQGFEVACPQLLTCTTEASNTCSFNDDVNLLYPLVFDLASEGKNIICLMHGYGGYIGTEILGDLSASPRAQQGLAGGIVHMVWISSPLPDTGISMLAAMGGSFPDFMPLQAGCWIFQRLQLILTQ
jgi:dienelactone hydrolase